MGLILPIVAALLLVAVIIVKKNTLFAPILLMLAGGLSNYSDRVQLGYVRDPLVLGSFVFNVADIAIAIGMVWAIWIYTNGDSMQSAK